MSRERIKFVIGGSVVVAALGMLIAVSFQGNMAYYIDVEQFLDQKNVTEKGNFRLRGYVQSGSIRKQPGRLGAHFKMGDGTHTIPVHYAKELPDTFGDHAEVVVEGKMGPDGIFVARTLLAQVPVEVRSGRDLWRGRPALSPTTSAWSTKGRVSGPTPSDA